MSLAEKRKSSFANFMASLRSERIQENLTFNNRIKSMLERHGSLSKMCLSSWKRESKSAGRDTCETTIPVKTFSNFGNELSDIPCLKLQRYEEKIPFVLITLRFELEDAHGFTTEGIFRVSGSLSEQKRLKNEIDTGEFLGCKSEDDVVGIASLILEWFRSLPSPLFSKIPTCSLLDGKFNVMKDLPEPQLSIFSWLLDLMADICEFEKLNRMNPQAMAIVIAPNLYQYNETATALETLEDLKHVKNIVLKALIQRIQQRKLARVDD